MPGGSQGLSLLSTGTKGSCRGGDSLQFIAAEGLSGVLGGEGRHPRSSPMFPNPTCGCRVVLPVPGPAVAVSEQGQGHRVGTATER